MHRFLSINKTLATYGKDNSSSASEHSLAKAFLKIPARAYNAVFTPMGRKSFYYFVKESRTKLNSNFRRSGTLVYSLKNNSSFVLHRGNRLSELIYLEGAYEPLETSFVSKIVQPGDVALDLGANVGYFTVLLDRLVKPDGQVHAFEPGEKTFDKLMETRELMKLKRAVLHQMAVGEAVGVTDFWSSTSGLDAQQNTFKNETGHQMQHGKVEATTLDAFVAKLPSEQARQIAFVKCDIEGSEFSMLKGAQDLLNSRNPPIWLIEHNRMALGEHGATSQDLLVNFENFDAYFTPLCWPPSIMASPQASKWNGVPDELPDECNLIIFPRRGTYAKRAAVLRQAGLLPQDKF